MVSPANPGPLSLRELRANGACMNTSEIEKSLDDGNFSDAESSLQQGLSLNFEEARALLGRLEYQRGNLDRARRLFDGVDLLAALHRLKPSLSQKQPSRKAPSESHAAVSHHSASLLLEGIYLNCKAFQKLGLFEDAARECRCVVESVNTAFRDAQIDDKLQEIIHQAVELLPELYLHIGSFQEAVSAFRQALSPGSDIDEDRLARIQKRFAVFLLHGGVESDANLEEAILLLMSLFRKFVSGKIEFDPSVAEHLTFALSLVNETTALSKVLEQCMPGVVSRVERWNTMALCCDGAAALNLLEKSLHPHESPDDVTALLLAARLCSGDPRLAGEGARRAKRAIVVADSDHLKGAAFRFLGLCLSQLGQASSSDGERSRLQAEALKALDTAVALDPQNADLVFELGFLYAQQRNLKSALRCAKKYMDSTSGCFVKGWVFLALVLSAQQRFSEAEVVTDAAIDETGRFEQGPLLKLKAKLKLLQMQPNEAIESYRNLLALVQTQKMSRKVEDDDCREFEVWEGLAELYAQLGHWDDVAVCLDKARELSPTSARLYYMEGNMQRGRGDNETALTTCINGLFVDPGYVPCKVLLGAILSERGDNALPVARSFLTDALRTEPTSRTGWHHLGMIHKNDGRLSEAVDCFQAASMLEESEPAENFSSIFSLDLIV